MDGKGLKSVKKAKKGKIFLQKQNFSHNIFPIILFPAFFSSADICPSVGPTSGRMRVKKSFGSFLATWLPFHHLGPFKTIGNCGNLMGGLRLLFKGFRSPTKLTWPGAYPPPPPQGPQKNRAVYWQYPKKFRCFAQKFVPVPGPPGIPQGVQPRIHPPPFPGGSSKLKRKKPGLTFRGGA